jgi:hypothetical protein
MTFEIREINVENFITKEMEKHILIDKGNGEMTGMPKAVWDEAEQSTPSVIDEAEVK